MKRILWLILLLVIIVGGLSGYNTYSTKSTYLEIGKELARVEQVYQDVTRNEVQALNDYFELREELKTGTGTLEWTPVDGIFSAINVAQKQVNRLGKGDYSQRLESLAAVQISLHKIYRSVPIDHPAWVANEVSDLRVAIGESAPVRQQIEDLNSAISAWHKLLEEQTGLVTAQMLGIKVEALKFLGFEGNLEEATQVEFGE